MTKDSASVSSSLAALSAQTSLKRSRVLFDVNPYATYIPTTDSNIAAAAIERRKRRAQPHLYNSQHQSLASKDSNALAVISTSGSQQQQTPGTTSGGAASQLTIHRGDNQNDAKHSGILVVSAPKLQISLALQVSVYAFHLVSC